MALALDVTGRVQIEAEQSALHEIAHAVAGGATLEALFDLVVARVATLFDAVGAAVFRYEGGDWARLLASAPTRPEEFLPGRWVPLAETTAVARVRQTGSPVVVAEYGSLPDPLVAALRRLGAVGGAAAPITIRGELWGALGLGGANQARLTDATASRLARFAELVAINVGNVQAWETLAREATTDALTGLPNRRTFTARLVEELARAERHEHPLALLLFDVDRFKAINDSLGHVGGDRVLTALSRVVSGESRGDELVARIGGEEFAVLLPETGAEGGRTAGERFRRAVAGASFPGAGHVTISVGIDVARPGDDAETLIARADQALYAAKAGGRNTTRMWRDVGGANG